jgi:hypothetical protein
MIKDLFVLWELKIEQPKQWYDGIEKVVMVNGF